MMTNILTSDIEPTIDDLRSPLITLNDRIVILHGGWSVPFNFYKTAFQRADARLKSWTPCSSFTARQLLGDTFWRSLGGNEPELAGKCIADMVKRQHLPFVLAERNGSNALTYRAAPMA